MRKLSFEPIASEFLFYRSLKELQTFTLLTLVACIIAVATIMQGLSDTQTFALSQAHDLTGDPGTFDPTRAFSLFGAHPPLQRILIYIDGVRFQVWITIGLIIRLCSLLTKTRIGFSVAAAALLFSAFKMGEYGVWSFNLLLCSECLGQPLFIAASRFWGLANLLSMAILVFVECSYLLTFVINALKLRTRPA